MQFGPPVLAPDSLYAAYDRIVCDAGPCAGASALYAGVTLGGYPLHPVTAAMVTEWKTHGLGPLTCECGRLTTQLTDDGRLRVVDSAD